MTKDIFDAYVSDGWHLFKLYKTRDGKGNAVKGMYATPKGWNDYSKPKVTYSPTALYGGVPPSNMVCIDWDVKNGAKSGDKSFTKLQKDLGVTLETQVMTPSGGGHCYVRLKNLPDETPKLKKNQDMYPDIDFQSHGSEFVVLGGQTIEGYGDYSWVDEDFEYFVNKAVDFSNLELRKAREIGGGYDSVDEDIHYLSRPPEDEVRNILDMLDPEMPYDEWASVIMAINSWDLNGEKGLELVTDWSLKSKKHNMTPEQIEEKYALSVSDTPEFYNKLFTIEKKAKERKEEGQIEIFKQELNNTEEYEDLEPLAFKIQGTRMRVKVRDDFIDNFCEKSKMLIGKPEKVKWKKALAFIDHEKAKQRQEAAVDDLPDFVNTKTGVKYLNTYANLKCFIEKYSEHVMVYDTILKRNIIDNNYMPKIGENSITYSKISDEVVRKGLPIGIMSSHFDAVIFSNNKNMLMEHIENLDDWDGKTDYIGKIANTLETATATADYKRAVIEAFIIQAIAAWDGKVRTPHRLSRLDNVLTFTGKQGSGKTTWVGELMPNFMSYYFKDGVELDPSNKDSYIQATSAALVELGELDATTRKSDIASLKAFLSNTEDEFRAPYGRSAERFKRQTVFVGTVNTSDFLKDSTGSRRFLVLDVVKLKLPEASDVEGMWAQALALYLNGADWRLEDKHAEMQETVNTGFTDVGEAGDLAEDFSKCVKQSDGEKARYSLTKILEALGVKLNSRGRSDFLSTLDRKGIKRYNDGRYYLPKSAFTLYSVNAQSDNFDNLDIDLNEEF